ncbi:hypothetical protein D3C72_1742590 [compost metagenome]
MQFDAVDLGVEERALHRLGVDIHRLGGPRAQLARRDGQDAGAATVVEQGGARGQLRFQPRQAQVRRGVAARAEGQARIKLDVDGAVLRGDGGGIEAGNLGVVAVPARHDPEAFGDMDGTELRLRQTHPIGIGHVAQAPAGKHARVQFARRGGFFHDLRGIGAIGQQGDDKVAVPGLDVGFRARLAEQGALDFGAQVGVLDGHGQHARLKQSVRQGFGLCL